MEYSSIATVSASPMPKPPPEPPSPITRLTIGVLRSDITSKLFAIASCWPECSALTPG